jgi:tetratricopeptide (TPR) repeat protein
LTLIFLRLYRKKLISLKKYAFLCWLMMLLLLGACAPENNSIVGSAFHNLNAHFNGYYYAREEALAVEKLILKSVDDDHNQILQLYPRLDTAQARSYVKQTDEIIKMASISIQRHPNSRWVDDNYIMVGLARLYACDYQNAILTFKYVNQKSTDPNVRHRALVHLIRTFTEQGDYVRAEEAADFLSKEKLNRTNSKNLYLEKAYLYQVQRDYDKMVNNLARVDTLLTRNDRKGRIYFIVGQVYQKLGFGSEAYNYYRKCLATNPEYEIDFYARLNMAQVARLDNPEAIKMIRAQFEKMLKDEKNKEFKDKIYYEIGEFEWKQHKLAPAVANYKSAVRAGTNKRIQGLSFLRLGEIHFDSLKKYSLAKAYYDSALRSLPKDVENYSAINRRQEILVDFVKYSEIITLQDSLLSMAALDTAVLHKRIDSLQVVKEKALAEANKKKKKRSSSSSDDRNSGSSTFYQTETTTTGDWYFGNPTAVSFGQTEFQRIWGAITLEDNWRRSSKSTVARDDQPDVAANTEGNNQTGDEPTGSKPNGVTKKASAFNELYAQLPKTDEDKAKALGLIEDAYFHLGDLNYFKLNEKQDARDLYEKLIQRFPDSKFKPEVLYKLYLIAKEIDPESAPRYANALKQEFPTSTYAKILQNPDYLKETSITAEKQKMAYKEAYQDFVKGQLVASNRKIDEAILMGESGFLPQLDLLKILITGKTEDITRYQYELGEFAKKYPDSPLQGYAKQLLDASVKFQEKMERAKGIRFIRDYETPHQFVIVHKRSDNLSTPFVFALEKLNQAEFKSLKLQTSNLAFNDQLTMTFVLELPEFKSANLYMERVMATVLKQPEFANFKFDIFVITKENFGTFYRTRALDEYLAFYDRNY